MAFPLTSQTSAELHSCTKSLTHHGSDSNNDHSTFVQINNKTINKKHLPKFKKALNNDIKFEPGCYAFDHDRYPKGNKANLPSSPGSGLSRVKNKSCRGRMNKAVLQQQQQQQKNKQSAKEARAHAHAKCNKTSQQLAAACWISPQEIESDRKHAQKQAKLNKLIATHGYAKDRALKTLQSKNMCHCTVIQKEAAKLSHAFQQALSAPDAHGRKIMAQAKNAFAKSVDHLFHCFQSLVVVEVLLGLVAKESEMESHLGQALAREQGQMLEWSRERPDADDFEDINYSNPHNNHDHLKHKHSSRREAEREVARMKKARIPGHERLNAYYNPDLEGWFVGKSKYD